MGILIYGIIAVILVIIGGGILLSMFFRKVVDRNMVHIVQGTNKTHYYGQEEDGNSYYNWPRWVPFIGVTVMKLPISNFDLSLRDYDAYDMDRVPFMVDVTAFYRIVNPEMASERVSNMDELNEQLDKITQGAVRTVLASAVIDTVMTQRAEFGDKFTTEVSSQLAEWGVDVVKPMELMDVRDDNGSNVIANIMAKKSSHIEMESRLEVAKNHKLSETAEIEAKRAIDVSSQEAEQKVGEKTAEKDKIVGIANQLAQQEILTAEKVTKEKDMEVKRVELVKQAEITRDEQVVAAEQEKRTTVIIAEGQLTAQQREADGIEAVGNANASAEKAMQLAPVEAQIVLAQEIGENEGYQEYLVSIEAISAQKTVGVQQATALQNADVKVISNIGNPTEGTSKVMDLFTSKGGTNISSMLEAVNQSKIGKSLLEKIGVSEKNDESVEEIVIENNDDSTLDAEDNSKEDNSK